MPAAWTRKDERQYKHILSSCKARGRYGTARCKRIAGATVNKQRAAEGRTLSDAQSWPGRYGELEGLGYEGWLAVGLTAAAGVGLLLLARPSKVRVTLRMIFPTAAAAEDAEKMIRNIPAQLQSMLGQATVTEEQKSAIQKALKDLETLLIHREGKTLLYSVVTPKSRVEEARGQLQLLQAQFPELQIQIDKVEPV